MEALLNFITSLGVIAVLFVIYAESGLLIGFFLPGDSLLFTAGFLVQQGIGSFGNISIHIFAFLLFLCALFGQQTGYFFGKKVGRRLFERKNGRLFRKENLLRTEAFYKKHGPIAIVLACFVPVIRTFVPIVAGVSKMPYRKFVPFNIVGAFTWTYSFTYLGYYAGKALHNLGINVEVAAIIIIILSISPILWHTLHTKEKRSELWANIKREMQIIFSRNKNP
jgi:membrane-associated protein